MKDTNSEMPSLIANFQCSHCAAPPPTRWQDENGLWHSDITHDESCPTRTGAVSAQNDIMRALVPDWDQHLEAERLRREAAGE